MCFGRSKSCRREPSRPRCSPPVVNFVFVTYNYLQYRGELAELVKGYNLTSGFRVGR